MAHSSTTPSSPPAPADGGLAPPASAASTERGRYEFLDAVRGVAAVLVALQHGAEAVGLGGKRTWVNFGEVGVVAFFLVSGFIIPRSLKRHGSLGRFWLGRAFRLYPAYWLSLLGAVLLIASTRLYSPFLALPHPGLGVVANATMLQSFLQMPNAIGVYWTLSLELVFYGLGSLLFVAGLLGRSVLCLGTALALDLIANLTAAALHRSLPAGLLGLLVSAFAGAVAYRSLSEAPAQRALRRAALPLAAVLSLGLYLRFGRYPVAHEIAAPAWGAVVLSWALGYGLFFGLFVMRHRQFPRVLQWLGRISYSFYLWHVLVFVGLPRVGGNRGLTLVLGLGLTALIADLSFRWVERPALRLQRRWFPESPRG